MILTIKAGPGGPVDWVDTDTMTRHKPDEVRPCNDTETAYVADIVAEGERAANAATLRGNLAAGVTVLTGDRDAALADRATAAAAVDAALAAKAQADTLKGQADAMAARTTGDIRGLAQGVGQLALLVSGIEDMLTGVQTWRQAADQTAAHTSTGLVRLARLTAGLLNDPPT